MPASTPGPRHEGKCSPAKVHTSSGMIAFRLFIAHHVGRGGCDVPHVLPLGAKVTRKAHSPD